MFSRRFLFSILILDNTHSPYQLPPPPPPLLSPFVISLSSRQAILNGRVSCLNWLLCWLFAIRLCIWLICAIYHWREAQSKWIVIILIRLYYGTWIRMVWLVQSFSLHYLVIGFFCICFRYATIFFIALNAIQNYALICATQSEYEEYYHTWQQLSRGHPYESNKSLYLMRINVAFLSKIKISQMKSSVPGRKKSFFLFSIGSWILITNNLQINHRCSQERLLYLCMSINMPTIDYNL